uniref:NAD-specific glutamate dehydrogenase n=1 Tax=Fusarium oxysporum (strain Fo5176) TaxID=660025 RepID=A0A0D2XB24_FUSOF
MHARGIDLLSLEILSHLEHELLRAANVVLGRAVAKVEIFLVDLGKIHAEVVVVGHAVDIGLGEMGLEDISAEAGAVTGDTADLVVEGNGAAGAVDPGDGTMRLALGNGVEDGHHGSDTDTGRDEDNGNVGRVGHVEVELASRVSQLNDITLVLHVDKEVGDNTGVEGIASEISTAAGHVKSLVSLDGNAVVVRSRSLAQGVLARLDIALVGDGYLNRNILTGLKGRKTLSVDRNEVEGVDIIRLLNLLLDTELTVALPLAKVTIELSLTTDEHLGKHPVCLHPSLSDLGCHGRTEDFCEGSDEILLDDGIMLWLDAQGAMLVAHALHLGDELCDVVDVIGVAEDDGGEGTRLATVGLVDGVEVVVELGVITEHVAVEDGGDALSVVGEGGDGAPDEPGLLI